MKAFNYKGRSVSGASVDGVVEANTPEEAIEKLREGGLIVESIKESAPAGGRDLFLGSTRTRDKELSVMCNQFSIILQAGMPIVRTLELVAGQTTDKRLKTVLNEVASDVSAGYGLADSFSKHGKDLPSTFIESVRAGEASGTLEEVFKRMAAYYERSSKAKSRAKSALIYPAFVAVLAVIVVAIIMVFAVPAFARTFEAMNLELPAITRFLIDSSNWWSKWFLLVALIVVLALLALQLAKRNKSFRESWSKLGLSIPVLGKISENNGAHQYASTMSMMMAAGLPVTDAIDVTARSLSNAYMASCLASTQVDVEAGKPLSTSLAKTKAFPDLVVEMTGIGEQTGSLENTLEVMADYYANEVETTSTRALSLLEPIIIVVLAAVVCFILLAVYLPMFTMYGGF
ncbi:MAG: type II secretion system F family protein [Eggerthellaceae bacterium]|nr:type II secretion system F family protein [Eggerthellaceae bacterium]